MTTVFLIDDDPDRRARLTAQIERGRRFATKSFAAPAEALAANQRGRRSTRHLTQSALVEA